jgi:hypothetical protein
MLVVLCARHLFDPCASSSVVPESTPLGTVDWAALLELDYEEEPKVPEQP